GKLRRYFNAKNFTDPFRVLEGIFQSFSIVKKIKPKVIFSKGGFVSVPVVIGGWMNGIPVIIHESDMTPGLANKISAAFASKICINFPSTEKYFSKGKVVYTGTPIRKGILNGSYNTGLGICGFEANKPVVMVMGGSLGSRRINSLIRKALPHLLKSFQVVHVCGRGNVDPSLSGLNGYKQFEYVNEEQPHLFKIANLIISRAGANSIFEFLKLKLPNILIPLSTNSSRGDQIYNARYFEKMGFSKVLFEENINADILCQAIFDVYNSRGKYIESMRRKQTPDGTAEIMKLITAYDN
ncbi:MAG TPA: undecaprenyldiphospho-muramoylpentapeptide beta-N-acetylglucosaminyltransferase, partial [Clostridiaceae bacterium]|nr:undecaprenyldiphospho-muramoylpentapeptide beta-N-acetylglucosaminyltransferase [Clostridiaceae bacterium]